FRQVESNPSDAVKKQQGSNRDQPNAQTRVAPVGNNSAEEKSDREKNSRPDQAERDRRPRRKAFDISRGQAGGDVDKRESGAVRVRERKHEPAHVVSDIPVPTDLKSVQDFEATA